jgi:hypothetical protein
MIQRIQSLLLLGVALASIALFFVPFSEKTVGTSGTETAAHFLLTINGVSVTGSDQGSPAMWGYVLLLTNLLIMALSAYSIFLYKNRPAQIRLCMFGGLLATVFLVVIFYYSENMGPETERPHYLAGVYLVALQVFLLLGARRFIRKDEMLVRAADRIR